MDQGEVDHHALPHQQAVLNILIIPSLSLHFLLLLIILLLLLTSILLFLITLFLLFIILHLFLPLQEVWKASRLSLIVCRDLKNRHWNVCIQVWSPPPPGSKIIIGSRLFTGYKILTGFTGITRQ